MVIGTVKEIKKNEYRVGLTPACVKAFTGRGHEILIEKGAGEGTGFEDMEYESAGGRIVSDKKNIYDKAEMIIKVKEPQPSEYDLLREGQIIYTYFHFAADEKLTQAMLQRKIKAIAYETIETEDGQLPCLKPMSEIAGRLSVQEGAKYLEKAFGGRGILLGGVPGVARGKVAILGGGVVGTNAAKIASGIGADVTILDVDSRRLEYLDDIFGSRITTLYSNDENIEKICNESDLIIGAVLLHGAKAPRLITRNHLKRMKRGSVIVDVAVDQGGCVETTRPTTHADPVYVVEDVVHYCVANMPGTVALSSTQALTSTTLPFGLQIAEKGIEKAAKQHYALERGVNMYNGICTYKNVAEAFNFEYSNLKELL